MTSDPDHLSPADPACGHPPGAGSPGHEVVVVPRADGPLLVEGPVVLTHPDGSTEVADRLFLCRCGASGDKPRCDGSHKRIGFRAPGVPPTSRSGRSPRPAGADDPAQGSSSGAEDQPS